MMAILSRRHALGLLALAPGCASPGRSGAPAVALDDPAIRIEENVWIPMSDGARLAARLFRPAGGPPCGAVLEYLPYRKRDSYRYRDDVAGPFLAKAGVALVRVDIRGTGESDGVIIDEYMPQEQADALEVIAWIAAQPWCNGAVGMRGISYGAFVALQAAEKAPPALKAIVPACGTEQRYVDDVHYMGGCLLHDQITWAAMWQAIMRLPPDPLIVGQDRWRAMWLERLDAAEPLAIRWARHQTLDAFWRNGSVSDYGAIQTAILHAGGVLDGYVNSIPRLLRLAPAPQWAVIGPWAHKWPGYPEGPAQNGQPGPGVDWLPFEAAWWRERLHSGGAPAPPAPLELWAYRLDVTPGATYPKDALGAWIKAPADGAAASPALTLFLNPGGALAREPEPGAPGVIKTDLAIGFANRGWYSIETPADLWREQSGDDAGCLTFDTAPLPENLDVLGQPTVFLRIRADKPVAKVVARITEVWPDGSSHFVSHAVLNLTHRDGSAAPSPLEPGRDYDVAITGLFCCYRFSKGARIRVALSETWWPVLWPSPEPVQLEIATGASRIVLPLAPEGADPAPPFGVLRDRFRADAAFDGRYHDRMGGVEVSGQPGARTFRLVDEVVNDPLPVAGAEITLGGGFRLVRTVREDDPTSADISMEWRETLERPGWRIEVVAVSRQRCTATDFVIDEQLEARENGALVKRSVWSETIPRQLV